jgi:ribosomal protein L14
MVFKETRSLVGNKCGVYLVKVFNVYNKQSRCGYLGTFQYTSNQLVSSTLHFLKKKKNKSFFIRGVYNSVKFDGSVLNFNHNSLALLKKRLYVKGSATVGPIPFNIKRKKILSSFIKKL